MSKDPNFPWLQWSEGRVSIGTRQCCILEHIKSQKSTPKEMNLGQSYKFVYCQQISFWQGIVDLKDF